MKYAVVNQRGGINRTTDEEPRHVPENATVVQLTDEQAQTVEEGRQADPRVLYGYHDGDILPMKYLLNPNLQVYDTLVGVWESTFTEGERAFLEPLRKEVAKAIKEGDFARARLLVETAPSITQELDNKRNSLLAMFPENIEE